MRRPVEIVPSYLVKGLLRGEEEVKKEAGPQELWRKVEINGGTVIVRTAKKIGRVVRNDQRH